MAARPEGNQCVARNVDGARRIDGHAPCRTRSELANSRLVRLRFGSRHLGGIVRRYVRSQGGASPPHANPAASRPLTQIATAPTCILCAFHLTDHSATSVYSGSYLGRRACSFFNTLTSPSLPRVPSISKGSPSSMIVIQKECPLSAGSSSTAFSFSFSPKT